MTTKSKLNEIKSLLSKAQLLLEETITSQPKQSPGMPPSPTYGTIEWKIWKVWDRLKGEGTFSAWKAKQIVTGKQDYRTDSAYSAILSRWSKEEYIELVEQGTGQSPSKYRISN